jgi:hypothetical protein
MSVTNSTCHHDTPASDIHSAEWESRHRIVEEQLEQQRQLVQLRQRQMLLHNPNHTHTHTAEHEVRGIAFVDDHGFVPEQQCAVCDAHPLEAYYAYDRCSHSICEDCEEMRWLDGVVLCCPLCCVEEGRS